MWDKKLPKLEEHSAELTAAGIRLGYVEGPEGQTLRMVERPVDLGADGKFLVSVAGDATEIFDETRSFDYYLGGTFAALSIVLVLTTIFQVRFGLAPLKRISDSIADIRSGRAERLEGEFPVEIAPLARETNALIDANREIVERARTHVGNLAHAIKTPLSVIVNEAAAHAADPFATKVLEQADVMRDQVAHHLERARIAARLTVIGTVIEVAPVSMPCAEPWRRSTATVASPSRLTLMHERNFAANGRTLRKWPVTSSTTPANGRHRGYSSRCWWNGRSRPAPVR